MHDLTFTAAVARQLTLILIIVGTFPTFADVAPSDWRQKKSDLVWDEVLRPAAFQDREIKEGASALNILEIKAPYRAEDATIVPITVHTKISQSSEKFISKISIYLDKNPLPLVGVFEFSQNSGKADLAMRVRVDTFTYIRAIAETNTGELFMSKTFIRATGACSAPPPKSIDDSFANMGKMKMKLVGTLALDEPNLIQLKIKHPNITGLQPMKIGSRVMPPPHFVNSIEVMFEGNLVMKALLTFSVSMDPSLRFFFKPEKEGVMSFIVSDTKSNSWSDKLQISKL
jgi:sulfur-oxidizing protein SoxY